MVKDDPQYVRLATRLSRGMVADLDSHWSIAGLDVRQFPKESPGAARFVRAKLNAGLLDPASKAEWEEVHDESVTEALASFRPDHAKEVPYQEAKIQRAANKARAALEASRDEEDDSDEREADRRAAILADQEEANLATDDPEEQRSRSTGQKAKKGKKSSKARKPASGAEDDGEE